MRPALEMKDGPLYVQLQDIIIKKIEMGEYLPGEMLLSERMMAEVYGVNRMTVKNAITALVGKGYLYRIPGKGSFVQKKSFDKLDLGFLNEAGNSGITAMVKSHGIRVSNEILAIGILQGNRYFGSRLGIGEKSPIFVLHRIRYGNDEPIAVEYTYAPLDVFPDIQEINFKYVSLYDYMESKGKMPLYFDQKFQIISVPEKEGRHLELSQGQPVYYFEFIGSDRENRIVEYTESYTRTDKSEFKCIATT